MYLPFFLIIFSFFTVFSKASKLETVRKTLIQKTKIIQEQENLYFKNKRQLKELSIKEKDLYQTVSHYQHQLGTFINHLRYKTDDSPVLAAISNRHLPHVVHTSLLLKRVVPKISDHNKKVLKSVKDLTDLRKKIQHLAKVNQGLKADLLKMTSDQISLLNEKRAFFQKTEKSVNQPLEGAETINHLIRQLSKVFKQKSDSKFSVKERSEKIVDLIQPVYGKVYDRAKDQRLDIQIECEKGAQVVAPAHGSVVFIGKKDKTYFVILKQDDFFISIEGLSHVQCAYGEDLSPLEPIGRSDTSTTDDMASVRLQLYWGDQSLSPAPYLKGTNKRAV